VDDHGTELDFLVAPSLGSLNDGTRPVNQQRVKLIGTSSTYSITDRRSAPGTEVRMHGCNRDLRNIAT